MEKIQISSAFCANPSFNNGISTEVILPGSCPRLEISRCFIKAGHVWAPQKYAYQDKVQIFVLLHATGFVLTGTQAFNVTDSAVFVPNFDREDFEIHAGSKDQEIIRIIGNFSERDVLEIGKSHLIFPRFRLVKDGWEYTTRETTKPNANTRAFVLIENRKLG